MAATENRSPNLDLIGFGLKPGDPIWFIGDPIPRDTVLAKAVQGCWGPRLPERGRQRDSDDSEHVENDLEVVKARAVNR
jgi:hypothetical protein